MVHFGWWCANCVEALLGRGEAELERSCGWPRGCIPAGGAPTVRKCHQFDGQAEIRQPYEVARASGCGCWCGGHHLPRSARPGRASCERCGESARFAGKPPSPQRNPVNPRPETRHPREDPPASSDGGKITRPASRICASKTPKTPHLRNDPADVRHQDLSARERRSTLPCEADHDRALAVPEPARRLRRGWRAFALGGL